MPTLSVVIDGPDGSYRLDFPIDSIDTVDAIEEVTYDQQTGHWVVTTDAPPSATRNVEFTPHFTTLTDERTVRFPRHRVYYLNVSQLVEPSDRPSEEDLVDERHVLVTALGHEERDVYDSDYYEFLAPPSYDRDLDHWVLSFHNPHIREGERTWKHRRLIPREHIYFVV